MSCMSMTGFGHARVDGSLVRIVIELRTVNHRFSEWNLRLPRELLGLEEEVRAYLATRVARGRGDLFFTMEPIVPRDVSVRVDFKTMDALHFAYREACARYDANAEDARATLSWFGFPDVVSVERAPLNASDVAQDVMVALALAADELVSARRREGTRLANDLSHKLDNLRLIVEGMRTVAPQVEVATLSRLRERMREMSQEVDESRLLTELAVVADKVSIDEEIVRLNSHLEEFANTLSESGPVGRRLDFIIQEMNREVNTIGSKSGDLSVSKLVVDAKVLIEQLREQVQNVE